MSNIDKTIENNQLYDYYKNLLTEKQRSYFELYFFEDLTLQEISEEFDVSRNAVHDSINKTINILNDLESKLKIKQKNEFIKENLEKLKDNKMSISEFYDLIEGEL
ncbi:hypothetical protein SCHIN_v1c09610 [Spiroplasma chinense]|uniref:UPF0122 protein SCHIN_v1c09610 n=1 Tax=Spiroplasma chinense TaxID=216932 RepID=A0A5B9Y4Y4_9MOLU|nr:sigma factor-like helix-turn-helix DNA-binding protein [Spiroplasma chinense]QEH62154.1 hypothetical protein SCHIN_v1c09610 [Spiroplasma chinense]